MAAMWDAMEPDSKAAYKRRTEQAKKEYLRQLASYRYLSYITLSLKREEGEGGHKMPFSSMRTL